jgi:hypothetical protein
VCFKSAVSNNPLLNRTCTESDDSTAIRVIDEAYDHLLIIKGPYIPSGNNKEWTPLEFYNK